jgi:hypothetical protein
MTVCPKRRGREQTDASAAVAYSINSLRAGRRNAICQNEMGELRDKLGCCGAELQETTGPFDCGCEDG